MRRALLSLMLLALAVQGKALAASPESTEVLVLLGSQSAYYREALLGLQEELKLQAIPVRLATDPDSAEIRARIVVAIGGKSALVEQPRDSALVYCMAPGLLVRADQRTGPTIRIETMPAPGPLLTQLSGIQPGLRRLGVLWTSEAAGAYVRQLRETAAQHRVQVVERQVDSIQQVPAALRALHGKVDALWLPLDPLLLDAESLSVLKNYSWANEVPFYVSSDGLLELGAAASVSSAYREIGRLAAVAVRQLLADQTPASVLYPQRFQTVLHLRAAAECGLEIPPPAITAADRVLP